MATSHSISNQDAILKDVYTEEKILEQSYGMNPFFALVEKKRGKRAGGRRYIQPCEIGNPGGGSSLYGTARKNGTASRYQDFILSRQTQYQFIQVDHELLFATEERADAFQEALMEFDRGFKSLGEKIGRRLYRTQGGSAGQLSIASTTTTTLTFTDNAAVFNFHVNDVLQFSTTDGTGSLLDGGDTVTVTAVDQVAGTVTINTDLATKIAGITTSSFVFQEGDYNTCLAGLEDWMPVDNRTTKLAASFNGVTRSTDPVYLGGVEYDGTGAGSLDEVMIKLAGYIGTFGGAPTHVFANPQSLSDLQCVSNSKVRIEANINTSVKTDDGKLIVGFRGYRVLIGGTAVDVYADRNCPSTRLPILQLDTWRLWHTGDLINWLGESYTGSRLMPSRETDTAESMLGSYMNLGCKAPGFNGVAKLNPSV